LKGCCFHHSKTCSIGYVFHIEILPCNRYTLYLVSIYISMGRKTFRFPLRLLHYLHIRHDIYFLHQ
jgi:hypothetical protein